MKGENKLYAWGLVLLVFGGAGLAEVITSNRGSFMISTIVFAPGTLAPSNKSYMIIFTSSLKQEYLRSELC